MTVDADYIQAISRGKYTVGDDYSDAITDDTLDLFLAWAQDRITNDGITLTATQQDQAVGLLVCHYCELDSSDKTGESVTGYYYSRQNAGTPWLTAYLDLIQQAGSAGSAARRLTRRGVTRTDNELGDLRFDRTTLSMEADN